MRWPTNREVVLAASLVACHSVNVEPAADAGPAYPSQRLPIAWPAHAAVVSLPDDDRLAIVDLDARRVVTTRTVGRDPVGPDAPTDLASSGTAAERVIYTLLAPAAPAIPSGPHAARASPDRVAWLVAYAASDARAVAELRVGPHSGALAASDDGKRLVVTHFDLRGDADGGPPDGGDFVRATLLDMPTDALLPNAAPPREIPACVGARGVALSPGGGQIAVVACSGEDALARVDLGSREVRRIPVTSSTGERTRPSFVATTTERAVVGCAGTDEARIVDLASGEVRSPVGARWTAPPTAARIAANGATAYVALDDGRVAVVDLAGGTTSTFGPVAGCAHSVDLVVDGADVVLACRNDGVGGVVMVLDAASLAPRGEAVSLERAPARVMVVR